MLQCFGLGVWAFVCDLQFTASKLKQRGGALGLSGRKRIEKGHQYRIEKWKVRGNQADRNGLRAGKRSVVDKWQSARDVVARSRNAAADLRECRKRA